MAAIAAGVAGALAAEALLAEFPELDQMWTMCGFTNALERARLIEYERFALLDAFGDYTVTMIESMADKNKEAYPCQYPSSFWYPTCALCESCVVLGS
jgi:hypothetical protein